MSRECAARFANKWDHLNQLSKELATVNNPEHQAVRTCITGDVALFGQHNPDLARTLYNQAIEMSPSIFDARLRLACMALFEEGKIVFNDSGYTLQGFAHLADVVIDEAYKWLQPVKLPESSISLKFAKELSQVPYRWLLMVQAICLRALIEEQKGDFQAAYENYASVWGKLITPVLPALSMPSLNNISPEISAADSDRIRQVSNVSVAVIAGKCRALLRMGRYREFLDFARNSCQLEGQLVSVPRVQLGLYQRFSEMLIFYHASISHLYNDENSGKRKNDFRTPFEEAILLLWITLERIHSEHPDLEADLGNAARLTARLLLSLCDQFAVISDLYRDEIALSISSPDLWYIRSLALSCSENYTEAYQAVKLAIRLDPKRIEQFLFASKLLLNYLSNSKKSLKLAEDALDLCSKSHPFSGICHFICGAAAGRHAYEVYTFSRRKQLQQEGLQYSIYAGNHQPKNQKYVFSIAAIQADIREINLALRLTKHSLSLNSSHFESWHLMALLLSSQKLYQQALQVCAAGSSECNPSFKMNFVLTRCKILVGQLLSEDLHQSEQNLIINQAFETFQSLFSDGHVDPLQLKLVDVGPFRSCPVLFRASDLDAPMTTTQQAIRAKSQTLQNYCSPAFKYEDPDSLLYRAVLTLVDLYAFIARTPTFNAPDTLPIALSCLDYLISLGSASWFPDIYVKIGQLSEQTQDDSGAISHYELALSFDGQHTEALVHIGALHKKMQKTVIAHEYLLNALRIDSTLHDAWLEIGHILHSQGKYDAACDAITTALELERTAPVETFYAVMRHA